MYLVLKRLELQRVCAVSNVSNMTVALCLQQ